MDNKEHLYKDLQYIKQIIKDSRTVAVDNGKGFIMWGIIIILGLINSYVDVIIAGNQYSGYIWMALIGGGWLFSIYRWYISRGKTKVVTFAGKIMGTTWLSAGIAMTILGFVGPISGAYEGVFVSPILAAVLGIAFLISAQVSDSKILKRITPLWWVGSIYMFLDPGLHTLIVMALMMLLLQVVPGIILYHKHKNLRAQNG